MVSGRQTEVERRVRKGSFRDPTPERPGLGHLPLGGEEVADGEVVLPLPYRIHDRQLLVLDDRALELIEEHETPGQALVPVDAHRVPIQCLRVERDRVHGAHGETVRIERRVLLEALDVDGTRAIGRLRSRPFDGRDPGQTHKWLGTVRGNCVVPVQLQDEAT